MTDWKYVDASMLVVSRVRDDGSIESSDVTRADIQEWIAAGNTPLPPDQPPFDYRAAAQARQDRIVKRLAAKDPISAIKQKEGWT